MGAMVSLAGVGLFTLGFFLPMFTQSNPQVPGSAHPVYEWQALPYALLGSLAALPLLAMLIVLVTSLAGLSGVHSPRLVLLKRAATGCGLASQVLFDAFVFLLNSIGYA